MNDGSKSRGSRVTAPMAVAQKTTFTSWQGVSGMVLSIPAESGHGVTRKAISSPCFRSRRPS